MLRTQRGERESTGVQILAGCGREMSYCITVNAVAFKYVRAFACGNVGISSIMQTSGDLSCYIFVLHCYND